MAKLPVPVVLETKGRVQARTGNAPKPLDLGTKKKNKRIFKVATFHN